MAKHRRVWNASVYEKYVREGRGCGWGSAYSPWIRVQDFASRGIVSRVKSRTTGRVHHLMSNNELAYFYVLDWSEKVMDIREQYPLIDIEYAVKIAAQAGIKYPVDNISGYPYVLTCDFMITTTDGTKARTIKMASELSNIRTLEKLEIERRYWSAQGVDWKIITEREIPYQKSKNIEWLYTAHGTDADDVDPIKMSQAKEIMRQLFTSDDYSVISAAKTVEYNCLLRAGVGLLIFKQLVLDRKIVINLDEPLNLNARGVAANA